MYLLDKLLGDNIAGSPKGGTGRDADVACIVSHGVRCGHWTDNAGRVQGTIPGWRHYKTLVMTFRVWVTALLNSSLHGIVAQATVSRTS